MASADIKKIKNSLARVVSIDHIDVRIVSENMFREEGFHRCFLSFDTTKFIGKKIRIKIEVI